MTSIFLSYARSDDEPFVRRLHADLTAAGFDAWFDKDDLRSRGLTFHQEIKDAIRERDRVIYIGGPKASSSLYVREEWQLALALDKPVIPILRLGVLESIIPGSLALLHCDDFSDDAQYPQQLAKLITNLRLPPPPLGRLFGNLPELPKHFQARPELLRRVKDALLVDLQKPVVVTGAGSRVGMQGMGGIGKSVLAAALARDQEIRRSYPDGVIWVRFGKMPEPENEQHQRIEQLQRDVVGYLGGDLTFIGHVQGKSVLRQLLLDKSVVFVFDDVWQARHVAEFIELGPRCRALITTRDAGIVNTMEGALFQVQLFSETESLQLLAEATKVEVESLPAEAREVARECGYLPLALALCAGITTKQAGRWGHVLERLRRADLQKIANSQAIEPQHRSIWVAMHASVEELAEPHRQRFAELSVFGPRGPIPSAAVQTLWAHTGQLDDLDCDELLAELRDRSLIRLDAPRPSVEGAHTVHSNWGLSLHDLLYDYARRTAGEPGPLHQVLLDAYRAKCPDGWYTAPRDGYLQGHLRSHLLTVGRTDELVELLTDLRWIQAKAEAGMVFELASDYAALREVLPEFQAERREEEERTERLCKYGHDLIDYARAHRQGNGQSVPLPEPPDTRALCMATAAPAERGSELGLSQAARVRAFANFVSAHNHDLSVNPNETIVVARNSARGGLIVEKAEALLEAFSRPWLARDPRLLPRSAYPVCKRVFIGRSSLIFSLAITIDGCHAVAASKDRTLRIWNLDSGAEENTLLGHTFWVWSVAITPDGRRAVSASWDHTLKVWDLESGVEEKTLQGHTGSVQCVAITPDGRRSVSGSYDNTVKVWDLASGALEMTLVGHTGDVNSVNITPNGKRAISASADHTLKVWDLESRALEMTLVGHTGDVNSVNITPDGKRAISASGDTTLKVWDLTSGHVEMTLVGHTKRLSTVAITPDGRRAVSGSDDRSVKIWNLEKGVIEKTLQGHTGALTCVTISPDGRRVVSSGGDRALRVWDLNGDMEENRLVGHTGWVMSIEITLDGRFAVSTSYDECVKVWDIETGAEVEEKILRGDSEHSFVAITLDGRRAVSASYDNTLRVWDLTSGDVETTLVGHTGDVNSVTITPDGRRAISASDDKTLKVWDLTSGEVQMTLVGHTDDVNFVTITPDGRRAVSASSDNTLRVWNLETGAEEKSLQDTARVQAVAITPDSLHAISGNWTGTLRVWDLKSGAEEKTLQEHGLWLTSVAITQDGRCAVSASADRTVKVWDLANGLCVATYSAGASVSAVAVYGDNRIVCGTVDGQMHFLKLMNERSI